MENPILAVQSTEGAAQSAIQYFENMRNFLVAVKDMKLLTFEASDLEKVTNMLFFSLAIINNAIVSQGQFKYCICLRSHAHTYSY